MKVLASLPLESHLHKLRLQAMPQQLHKALLHVKGEHLPVAWRPEPQYTQLLQLLESPASQPVAVRGPL